MQDDSAFVHRRTVGIFQPRGVGPRRLELRVHERYRFVIEHARLVGVVPRDTNRSIAFRNEDPGGLQFADIQKSNSKHDIF